MNLEELKTAGEAPDWMTEDSFKTLSGGYLLEGETPKAMYRRVAYGVGHRIAEMSQEGKGYDISISEEFFSLMWKNWLCPASPILSNVGTTRGLPISCFSVAIPDSVDGIMKSMHEVAMLSKNGGGVGTHWNAVRPRGSKISQNGTSSGTLSFLKILDSTAVGVSQGGVRRGAAAAYLDIEHGDFDEFLQMRKPVGDPNSQCLNLHHGVCISDSFMKKVKDGDEEARRRWQKVLKTRLEVGEPYMFFTDNVNNANPQCYKDLGLLVQASNICTEIMLFTDFLHSFVCCLSSLNLARYDEWKDTNLVQTSILFLDGVIEEFIQKAKDIPGFENSARFAIKSRAIGLGVLGFHTLLQQKGLAFDSMEAHILNSKIFKGIHEKGEQATKTLADLFGEPEWCKGHGRRHTHLFAIAPTASNSIISGGMSSGIEPITANLISKGTAKGTFQIKNKLLEELLETLGENTSKTWKSINLQDGSVQHLNFLTEEQKKIFLTAREIDQMALVRLAAARQKFIDQGQSLNLFFFPDVDQKKLHKIHVEAHKLGIKSLYYTHSNSPLKDSGTKEYKRESIESKAPKPPEDCALCEG